MFPKSAVYGLLAALLTAACSDGPRLTTSTPSPATWQTTFAGHALDLSAPGDGSVLVRLSAAPWLVRHDAQGSPKALTVDGDLDWATGFVATPDGSLYVAGSPRLGAQAANEVRIDHLSAEGAQLSTVTWQLSVLSEGPRQGDPLPTEVDAITIGADGALYALASSEAELALVQLDADGSAARVTAVPVPAARDASYFQAPQRLTVASDGSFLIQGGTSALWALRGVALGTAAQAWSAELGNVDNAVEASGVLALPAGGWFAAVASGSTGAASEHGFYHRGVVRLSADGRRLWGAGDFFEPSMPAADAELRHASLALLDDSVLLGVTIASATPLNADDVTLSAAFPYTTLARYSLTGDLVRAYELGRVQAALALEPLAAVLLGPDPANPDGYSLQRLDFEPLDEPLAKKGAACSVSADCAEGGACCASARGLFPITCSDAPTCPTADYCSDASQCAGGLCSIAPNGAGQGFCSAECQTNDDCPTRTSCVDGQCLVTCLSDDDCPYRDTTCASASDTEAQAVSVCAPLSAAQSL